MLSLALGLQSGDGLGETLVGREKGRRVTVVFYCKDSGRRDRDCLRRGWHWSCARSRTELRGSLVTWHAGTPFVRTKLSSHSSSSETRACRYLK